LFQYLLGELEGEELDKVEEQYVADEELHQHLLDLEEVLIDSYLRNELSASQRENFERSFLRSPKRKEQLEFAKTLQKHLDKDKPVTAAVLPMVPRSQATVPRPGFYRVILAIAAMIVVTVGVAYFLQTERPSEEAKKQERPPLPKEEPAPVQLYAYAFEPSTRSAGKVAVVTPNRPATIRLEFRTAQFPFPGFQMSWKDPDGRVETADKAVRKRDGFELTMPSTALRAGLHTFEVEGLSSAKERVPAGTYTVLVQREEDVAARVEECLANRDVLCVERQADVIQSLDAVRAAEWRAKAQRIK
jgi:hypothetical protein